MNDEAPVKLFLPQTTLEEWAIAEKADLVDGQLAVKETNSRHPVTPAVHFVAVASGDDTNALVGRVKTTTQVEAVGGEVAGESCLVGDTAYEIVSGYITEVQPPSQPKADPKKGKGGASPEADLLAAFILDKL